MSSLVHRNVAKCRQKGASMKKPDAVSIEFPVNRKLLKQVVERILALGRSLQKIA
jgi:hypothetical protein